MDKLYWLLIASVAIVISGSAACVKPFTAEKLQNLGWGILVN